MCLGLGLHFVMPAQNADEASRQRREELNSFARVMRFRIATAPAASTP
jgi:hypothetical protein